MSKLGSVFVFEALGLASDGTINFESRDQGAAVDVSTVYDGLLQDGAAAVVTRAPDFETALSLAMHKLGAAWRDKKPSIARPSASERIYNPTRSGSTHHGYNSIGKPHI